MQVDDTSDRETLKRPLTIKSERSNIMKKRVKEKTDLNQRKIDKKLIAVKLKSDTKLTANSLAVITDTLIDDVTEEKSQLIDPVKEILDIFAANRSDIEQTTPIQLKNDSNGTEFVKHVPCRTPFKWKGEWPTMMKDIKEYLKHALLAQNQRIT